MLGAPKTLVGGTLRILSSIILTLLALLTAPATSGQQRGELKFEDVIGAVVAVHAEVPATARTADRLGTERAGSGVVIDSDGLVLTIGYLIMEATRVEIGLGDGRTVPADMVAYDHNSGFGLIRANTPLNIQPIKLGDTSTLDESSRVLIAGFGGMEAVRPAMVVSRRSFAGWWEYLLERAIFTSPPYRNFGGAALLGPEGELLGIGSLIVGDAVPGEQPVPGNMFVPVDELKPILKDLIAAGRSARPPRPWVGIYAAAHRGKLFIDRVAVDGPAATAGLEKDDIIVTIGGREVNSLEDFYRKLWALGKAGVEVDLTVLRGGKLMNFRVRSADRHQWLRLNPT